MTEEKPTAPRESSRGAVVFLRKSRSGNESPALTGLGAFDKLTRAATPADGVAGQLRSFGQEWNERRGTRKRGRAADGNGFENRLTSNGNGGSNPSASVGPACTLRAWLTEFPEKREVPRLWGPWHGSVLPMAQRLNRRRPRDSYLPFAPERSQLRISSNASAGFWIFANLLRSSRFCSSRAALDNH